MSICHTVTQFIESMIDEIDSDCYEKVFQEAYDAFDNSDYEAFVEVMTEIGVDCKPLQINVLRNALEEAINEWLINTNEKRLSLKTFERLYLTNYCGLHWTEFCEFCRNNFNDYSGAKIDYLDNTLCIIRI